MPICASNLLSLCNVIITAAVSNKFSHFEVLGIERMITIEVVVVEKFKIEVAQKRILRSIN